MTELEEWAKENKPKISLAKKILGWILIVIGVLALITPFTPGSWLIFVGASILGIKLTYWEKLKEKIDKYWKK